MNKIYRLKFDRRRNELVVVSELTTGTGKEKNTGHIAGTGFLRALMGRLTPVALITGLLTGLLPLMTLAAELPTGGQIVAGQGSIATSGNTLTVTQNTHSLAANWHSFDIGKNNTVQFVQPDSSAVALNRVTGGSASQIMGTLKANGRVFLVNPAGVVFGKDAHVNTAGIVASTKNISTADFMQGNYTFSGGDQPDAQVVNQGNLSVSAGGFIVLAADRVSNQGTLSAPGGKVVLAAADRVTLQLDNNGLTSVSVNGSVVNALAENRGLISATDGRVYLTARGKDMLLNTVVNNSGTVEAKGLTSRGGDIVLDGGDSGVVSQSGRLLADSSTGRGGKITLEGQNLYLAAGSLTSATGKTGGGEVYVGGGWQGKDSRIKNASKVVTDPGATIDVSATQTGDGGKAVLWSDDYTDFRGTILAKGGSRSGNGGQVETSSRNNLQAFGTVDASAASPSGRGGEWLLDPTDVTIVAGDSNSGIDVTGKDAPGDAGLDTDVAQKFAPSADGAQIGVNSIVTQLNKGTNVNIITSGVDTKGQSGNITVNADIGTNIAAGATANLTLLADNSITLNNNITAQTGDTAGKLNLNLLASGTSDNGAINLGNATVSLNGGDLVMDNTGELADGATSNHTVQVSSGQATLTVGNLTAGNVSGWSTNGLNVSASGNITLNSSGTMNISRNGTSTLSGQNIDLTAGGLMFANGGTTDGSLVLNATSGNLNLTLADGATGNINNKDGGNITLQATQDVNIQANSTNAGTIVYLGGLNVTAGQDIVVNATTTSGGNYNVIRGDKTVLNATGNISLTASGGRTAGGNNASINLNQSSSLTAGKTITLNGSSTANGGGVRLDNVSLNAATLNLTGVSQGGTGFSLTNITLSEALKDLTNVTLSSAGSSANTTNLLDNSVVSAAITGNTLDAFLSRGTDNLTRLEMGGSAIFNNTSEGWTKNYSQTSKPYGGWLFSNTSVTAGGDVNLSGVGFSNATIDLSAGNLTLSNNTSLQVTGSNITVSSGNISLSGTGGTQGNGVLVQDSILNGQAVTVNGSTASTSATAYGVSLQNVTLNASTANITGVANATQGGAGFILANMTLQGGVSELTNLTLNASGSSDSAVSSLDSSVIRSSSDLTTIMSRDLGSTTAVDASTLNLTFDSNGWDNTKDTGEEETGSSATSPLPSGMNTTHDWVLSNTTVQSAGNVTLKGVSFSNSTLNITGALALSSDKWLTLSGDTLNVTQGVTLNGTRGVTLADLVNNSNNLTVTTPELAVNYRSGTLSNATLNVTGNTTISGKQNLTLNNVTLNDESGNLSVTTGGTFTAGPGTNLTAGNIALSGNGMMLNGTDTAVVLNATTGNLNLSISGSGNLNNGGGNITLQAAKDVNIQASSSNSGTIVYLGGMNVTAGQDIVVNATTTSGGNYNIIRGDSAVLNATGDISLTASGGRTIGGNNASINLNQSSSLTAGKTITLNGSSTANGGGVRLDNVSLNAATLNLTGVSQGGTGFSLTNITLSEALKDLTNVTLSSAGSNATTTNLLDNSVVNVAITRETLDNFLSRGADNLTQVEMGGSAIFNNTSAGWTKDYSQAGKPYGGWLFSNTSVTAGGDVNLSGVGFSNATIDLSAGNLTISDNISLQVTGSNITVSNGSVNLTTTQGDLSLTNTTLAQNGTGNTTLASAGKLTVNGSNVTATDLNLTSAGKESLTNSTLNVTAG
ncbi:TPA: filamentous hemagglutinin N-terminal domain-containing protein, partial [Salmonella enterica subsp. salamae serovar 9,46:z4,z24:z39:z42]|nr:filamentous hemagglutinin N-terminal domain-containing protein [Salmonella enterica subsp. salamae serovar 9,46:z4,z24:z39:z42]